MAVFELKDFRYSNDREGPFRLYIFDLNSEFHHGSFWFGGKRNADISVEEAKTLTEAAIHEGREVRITDAGDEMVFHAAKGEVIYRPKFWDEIQKAA